MSDHIQKTIEDAQAELRKHEDSVLSTKKLINQLCVFGKMPILYPNLEEGQATDRVTFRRNSFYGQPLAKCVGEYLEWRKTSGQVSEAPLDAIIAALDEGGFDLSSISKEKPDQKRGVAITLAKNSVKFHKLPNGDWGLAAWYPNIKAKKEKGNGASDPEQAESTTTMTTGATAGNDPVIASYLKDVRTPSTQAPTQSKENVI